LPNGLTNVCLVKPSASADPELRDPAAALSAALRGDPMLGERFAHARLVSAPTVIGPLAVDSVASLRAPDGLLLAGDAAGFVDPMTGDGLRFAIRGGELAAGAALRALANGWTGVQKRLSADRRREFGPKWRFNRALRALVGSTVGVRIATAGAPFLQSLLRSIILRASDCDLASHSLTTENTENTEKLHNSSNRKK
jgi:flavin-dependent dehydrogenase